MEKLGVIRPDVTPPENDPSSGKIEENAAAVGLYHGLGFHLAAASAAKVIKK